MLPPWGYASSPESSFRNTFWEKAFLLWAAPTYWYIRLNSMLGGISDEILTTAKYWRFIGIQFGFFVAIFCIYLVSSKYQKRSRNA